MINEALLFFYYVSLFL